MIVKKKSVSGAPTPSSVGNAAIKLRKVGPKFNKPVKVGVSKFKGRLPQLLRYITFFTLLCFFVFVIYLLTRKSDIVSSTWIYAAGGVVAGFLVILNIYLIRNHISQIKGFFSKMKLPNLKKPEKEKKIVGAVINDTKKPVKKIKANFKPRMMLFALLFIAAVVVALVLNSKGIISFTNPYVLMSMGALFLVSIVAVSYRFYKYHKSKSEIHDQLSKENIAVIKRSIVAKSSKYKTDLDRLYELINEKGKVTLSDVMVGFNVSEEMAQRWAKILESHSMIIINYPPFGEVQLCKK
jgi:hypothetical protein